MINLHLLHSVLIAGFGREGRSALAYLTKHYPQLQLTLADQNPNILKNQTYFTLTGPDCFDHLQAFDLVIRSPGISNNQLTTAKKITTAVNLFLAACPGTVIGVTGTKGKSTTSSLIHHFLKSNQRQAVLVGNIGTPALDYLDQIQADTTVIIELSSYQLTDIETSPHVAIILPISQEHLSYHGSFAAYVAAKAKIVTFQQPQDFVIYAAQNQSATQIAQSSPAIKIAYDQDLSFLQPLEDSRQIPLLGTANRYNLLAAAAAAKTQGLMDSQILAAIPSFKPLPHRLEPVGTFQNITFYNDSLATTPIATLHALEALGGKVATLIVGGFDRGLDFSLLGQTLAQSTLATIIFLPDTGAKIKTALKTANPQTSIKLLDAKDLNQAIDLAFNNTPPEKICLLSPAAASFNQFKDYADRGEAFKRLVSAHSPPKPH